jgi:multiple sugar transport system substrate-binding protein
MSKEKKGVSRRDFLKSIAVTAGTVAAGPILASCAQETPETEAPTMVPEAAPTEVPTEVPPEVMEPESTNLTIVVAVDLLPYLEYLNAQFKEEHPEATFDLITVGYDQLHTKIVSTLASGADCDIFDCDIIWVGEWAANGWAYPLNDALTDEERAGFLPGILEGLSAGDMQVAMPNGAWFKNLFFNKVIVEEAGLSEVPRTYEDLIIEGERVQAEGIVPYIAGFGWAQSEDLTCEWTQIMHAFGGKWFDDSGNWIVNNENAVAALTWMVENLESKVIDPASPTYNGRTVMNPFFVADYMAMNSWGLWGWNMSNNPEESNIVGDVDVGLLWGTKHAGTESANCSGMSGLCACEWSKNKEWAVEWLRRMSGVGYPENTVAALELAGTPPTQAWAWEDPDLMEQIPALPKIAAQAEYIVNRPSANIENYNDWSLMLQIGLGEALTFQKTPQEALDDIQANSEKDFPFREV